MIFCWRSLTGPDLRDPSVIPLNFTKSINLAISERGINALRKANRPAMLDAILKETIPMYGRMIHGERRGQLYQQHQAYDIDGKARSRARFAAEANCRSSSAPSTAAG